MSSQDVTKYIIIVEVLRTREAKLYTKAKIVVDVGEIHDDEKNRFDHHQRGFETKFDETKRVRLSSAGLVYKKFGRDILATLLGIQGDSKQEKYSDEDVDRLYHKVYSAFIEHIDGHDNGIASYEGGTKIFKESTSLPLRVNYLNPTWKEVMDLEKEFCHGGSAEPITNTRENDGFREAMLMTTREFMECVSRLAYDWWPAKAVVQGAYDRRFNIHPSGQIIRLDVKMCPFHGHLHDIEHSERILYVITPDATSSNWRVLCVSDRNVEFGSRRPLLEKFRGLSQPELVQVSGIPDIVFVHRNGFIGAAKSYEGALKLAIVSLEQES